MAKRDTTAVDLDVKPESAMRLLTLGVAELREEGGEAPVLAVGKPLALLVFLSASPGRKASRSTLLSRLWSDLEPDAAKHALRQTLWYLRRRANRPLVTASGDELTLRAEVRSDREELLRASTSGSHAKVIDLYRGAFMPAFAAPGSAGFEEWVALERRRLLEVFRHSAETLTRSFLAGGQAQKAVDLARRIRDEDINDERGWQLLLEALASAGDLLGARAEAQALEQLADRDEIELQPASLAAIRVARASNAAEAAGGDTAPRIEQRIAGSLVGRESAFSALVRGWEDAKGGRLVHMHVSARTGLGKTRVLRDLASRIRGMRGKVVTATGSIGAREIAYGVASELAAGLCSLPGKQSIAPATAGTLVALNPSLSTYFEVAPRHAPAEDVMRARTVAIAELATAISFEHPVAVLLDDLHWWDEASLVLINALVERLAESKILLVTAGRPEARRVPAMSQGATRHVELPALDAANVDELILSIAALPDEEWTRHFGEAVCAAARGSPLLTLELLQLLEHRSLLRREGGSWVTERASELHDALHNGNVLRARLDGMERGDSWLLTLLAIAGTSLPMRALVAASGTSGADVAARLAMLEARGLVVQLDDDWSLAHDEILEEVRSLLSPDSFHKGAADVGRALMELEPLTDLWAQRASRLLRLSGERSRCRALFRRYAGQQFAAGDRRSLRELARELLGPDASVDDVTEMVSGAPLTWRVGLVSRLRRVGALAAGIAAVAVVSYATIAKPAPASPDAVLAIVLADSSGNGVMRTVELRKEDWAPYKPLASEHWKEGASFGLKPTSVFFATWDSHRRALFVEQVVGRDGDIEIVQLDRGGAATIISPAPGDNEVPSVSPNGEYLAFTTARWDSLYRYDIALVRLSDSTITQLTEGPASDGTPKWSPSGRYLAFARLNWGRSRNQLCVIDMTNRQLQCRDTGPGLGVGVLGWVDDVQIVVQESDGWLSRLRVWQWPTGESATVTENAGALASLSPDGRWVFCMCTLSADGPPMPAVFPLGAPALIRQVDVPQTAGRPLGAVWLASAATATPARVIIDSSSARVAPVGVPIKLSASLIDNRDRVLPYRGSIRWSLEDTSAGTIDSLTGVVVARGSSSELVVRADVGGITRDSIRLRVTNDSARVRLDETWSDTWLDRWIRFGKPLPVSVEVSPGRRAFLNNGEGRFSSSALSRATFDGRYGLAVEFEVSTPVTRAQWQIFGIGIRQATDTLPFSLNAGANAVPDFPENSFVCDFGYPQEARGGEGEGSAALGTPRRGLWLHVPNKDWLSGKWHTVRLQLLPDGRCGLALDGRPVALVPADVRLGADMRILLGGNSVGTRMLVGRLRVFEGVLGGVGWVGVGG